MLQQDHISKDTWHNHMVASVKIHMAHKVHESHKLGWHGAHILWVHVNHEYRRIFPLGAIPFKLKKFILLFYFEAKELKNISFSLYRLPCQRTPRSPKEMVTVDLFWDHSQPMIKDNGQVLKIHYVERAQTIDLNEILSCDYWISQCDQISMRRSRSPHNC